MLIDMFVAGDPMPDQRPRVAKRGGIIPNPRVTEWKSTVQLEGIRYMGVMSPMIDPVDLSLAFHMPIPQSWSSAKKRECAGTAKTSKPDVDNLAKLVMDALNTIMWQDDAQIARLSVSKYYANDNITGVQIYADMDLWS